MTKFYPGDTVKIDISKLKKKLGRKLNPEFLVSLKNHGITGHRHGLYETDRKTIKYLKKGPKYASESKILFPFEGKVVEVWVDMECLKMVKMVHRHPLTSIFAA